MEMSKSTFVPNSFQTPNAYVDIIMPYLTGAEYKVLSYATRRILGFQKRQDRISISQFTDGTKNKEGETLDSGTGLGIGTVKSCLETLVNFGLMIRVSENDPRTNEGVMWELQWDGNKVNWQTMKERSEKKSQTDKKRLEKARSVRQTHLVGQTPACGTERTPVCPTDPPGGCGTETQYTEETQGNPDSVSLSEKEKEEVNKAVDFILQSSQNSNAWTGRDIFADNHLPLVDWYHKVTGQDCPKSKRNDWMKALTAWQAGGLTVADLQAAYDADIKWRLAFTSPSQLTSKAIALKAQKSVNQSAPTPEPDWMADARRRSERVNA
jgi:hypothetical protein